jgi:hypothetical protein
MIPVKETATTLEFNVLAVPKSSKNQIAGAHDDALKVKLAAPPVDGAANKMCLAFLAKSFQVPKSSLEIVSGHAGRRKLIVVRFSEDSRGSDERRRVKALIAGY